MEINPTLVGMTISLLPTIPASVSDYTPDIFRNANEDDTINVQDVTLIDGLKNAYLEMEGWIEERMGGVKGDFHGGSIDVMTIEDVAGWKEKVEKIMNA